MTAQEAKNIINTPGYPNVRQSLDAIGVALKELGDDATMKDIWAWAEGKVNDDSPRSDHMA